MAATRGVSILTGLALSILLARSLGSAGYGRYLFALTIAQMLAMPVLAGVPALLTRQVAIYRGRADWAGLRGIIRWSMGFVGLTTGFVAIGGVGYICFSASLSGGAVSVYLLALPLVVCLAFMNVGSAILAGFEYPFWSSLPDGLIRPLLLLCFVLGLIALGALTPSKTMILHAAAAFFALVWAVWMVRRHCSAVSPYSAIATPRFETRAWIVSLIPLSLIAAAAMVNSRLDVFMLGILSNKESVAVYGLATQMAGLMLIGQTIVNAIIGPRIARMYAAEEWEALQHLVVYACRLSSVVALVCVAGIAGFGDRIMEWFVGAEYNGTVQVSLIIGFGYLFSATMGPVGLILNMTGNEKFTMKVIGAAALLNAGANTYLIPRYGPSGAAFATLVSVVLRQGVLVAFALIVLNIQTTLFSCKPH